MPHVHSHKHTYTMVLYFTIRFSIHSNAGLGWNPMERNKEISEYSSNEDISNSSSYMDVCKVAAEGKFTNV